VYPGIGVLEAMEILTADQAGDGAVSGTGARPEAAQPQTNNKKRPN